MRAVRTRRVLDKGWRLHLVEPSSDAPTSELDIPAEVPGCVHTDLLRHQVIADPYVDRNEELQHWIGESVWEYRLSFQHQLVDAAWPVDLVLDGLDTLASVSFNGTQLARTANMHRTYRFDVSPHVVDGQNELAVRFDAPATAAAHRRDGLGDLPNPYCQPYNFIRKMASNFGWDWGPRLTTSGIWRPVGMETWRGARLSAVRPSVTVTSEGVGVAEVVVEVVRQHRQAPLLLRAEVAGVVAEASLAPGDCTARLRLEVPDAKLWWPAGRGAQPLYDLLVALTVDGDVVDTDRRRLGFRTIEIDSTPVDDGSRWAIQVNGERLWVRGFNWITDDTFPARVDRARYERRIADALAANANLLRVWGGGIYESDDFYDVCDERGVLVWQDFANACAAYPEDELTDEMRLEATDAINRLMSHPSLALWNGNNECLWGWWDWGWEEVVGNRAWGLGWYTQLLPGLVSGLDPRRPYLAGSPSSGDASRHPNDSAHGPVHIWDVWNERDYLHYRDSQPRFVAEFGFQGPPATATLRRAVSTRPLTVDDPNLQQHQKAFDGDAKLSRWLREHFGEVEGFADWHFLTQLNQARAIAVGVGHLRRLHQRCSGLVWWQLNDCWPSISWSVIDSAGRRKLAWYAARHSFTDRLLVVEPVEGVLSCTVVNDSRDPWQGCCRLQRVDTCGAVLAEEVVDFAARADSAVDMAVPPSCARPDDPRRELLITTADGIRACWAWAPDRDLVAPQARWNAQVGAVSDGEVVISVSATTLVRDLCLFADQVDPTGEVDSQLVTLLPGETHNFRVRSAGHADWSAALMRPVLRAANDREQP